MHRSAEIANLGAARRHISARRLCCYDEVKPLALAASNAEHAEQALDETVVQHQASKIVQESRPRIGRLWR